jgi:hypothetical protein
VERAKCRLIENESVEALQTLLGDKFGVKVSFKGGQIGGGFCVLRFEFAEVKKDGSVESREASAYKQYASMYGLPADGIGKAFQFRGKQYKVAGMKPGCKYSILAERQPDGKRFCFEARTAFPSLKLSSSELDDMEIERRIAKAEGQD